MTTEQWKPIVGFEGLYEVSSLGNTRSCRNGQLKALKADRTNAGYFRVRLFKDDRQHRRSIHRAILEAFVGPPPETSMHACHCNGVRGDNRLENLRWDTAKNNYADAVSHGTRGHGELSNRVKITAEDVAFIRNVYRRRDPHFNGAELGKRFGITRTHVYYILSNRAWNPEEIRVPSLNLVNKSLKYAASDETALDKACALLSLVAEYDPVAKMDATTALTALNHVIKHVAAKRKPVAPTPPK